jgi:hypothetical protein
MRINDSKLVADVVFSAVKRCGLVFVAWVISIVGSIYTVEAAHLVFVVLFYALSVVQYFVVVGFDQAMESSGETVSNRSQGSFWFLVNIAIAVVIHYLLFWGW